MPCIDIYFSQVHNITRATEILAITILSDSNLKILICNTLAIADNDIDVALADLASVVSHDKDTITFLHASLPDFLLDQFTCSRVLY